MARIDLKNAIIRIIDGYENTAAVNDTPADGDSTLGVDTFGTAGHVKPGTRFTIVGSTETYYVTDTNENDVQSVTVDATSGNYTLGFEGTVADPIATQTTANILFDATAATVQARLEALAAILPGDVLVTGADGGPYTVEFMGQYEGLDVKDLVATSVDLAGGTGVSRADVNEGGTPHSMSFTPALLTADGIPADDAVITFAGNTLEVNIGSGNLTYNEKVDRIYELDRGRLDTVRNGDEQPVEVSMDFVWDFITAVAGSDTPTIEDVLKRRGEAADWVSSATDDPCAPYSVDLEINYVPPCGNVPSEIITLPDFRYESLDHNTKDAQVSAQGKCNVVEASVVRVA